jgi:hypothetical protein
MDAQQLGLPLNRYPTRHPLVLFRSGRTAHDDGGYNGVAVYSMQLAGTNRLHTRFAVPWRKWNAWIASGRIKLVTLETYSQTHEVSQLPRHARGNE